MKPGPRTREQMTRLASTWKQGEHIVISGGTGSGKTLLARQVDQIRLDRNGKVVVFVCKLQRDDTLEQDYKGWTRWDKFKKNPSPHEKGVLLWPDTTKAKTIPEKREIQREEFAKAMDQLADIGKWTLHVDEGLYVCDPRFLRLDDRLAMLHALGRSSKLTIVTLVQRPSNIPLIVYGSASHAFVGRTREHVDMKRLSEMGGKAGAKELAGRIAGQGRHDFTWLPVAPDWEPESVNLRY